jgi:hypothetical protein
MPANGIFGPDYEIAAAWSHHVVVVAVTQAIPAAIPMTRARLTTAPYSLRPAVPSSNSSRTTPTAMTAAPLVTNRAKGVA